VRPYTVYLHVDLLDPVPVRGPHRRSILSFVRKLADDPFTPGDYIDKDESRRERQVKVIGEYAISYRPDHADRSVLVLSVRPADRVP
jgi:hypothetical protein